MDIWPQASTKHKRVVYVYMCIRRRVTIVCLLSLALAALFQQEQMEQLFPPELLLEVFQYAQLPELIAAYRVNQRWRATAPHIASSLRLRLFRICFHDRASHSDPYPLALAARRAYVQHVEDKTGCRLPDDYRTVLAEWPVRCAPPGIHWPHAARFFVDGDCSCSHSLIPSYRCRCATDDVQDCTVHIPRSLREEIFDLRDPWKFNPRGPDFRWTLFRNPPRLVTPEQNLQTLRFLRAHHVSCWSESEKVTEWTTLSLKCLRLSPYQPLTDPRSMSGEFYMVLEGPCRGQVHGWSSVGWYDGHEADSFLGWVYVGVPGLDAGLRL
jgi:hypothetical protein